MVPYPLKVWRSRKLANRYPDGKVAAHFRYQEFYCHDGTPIPASDQNLSGLRRHCLIVLEPMRAKFGACHVLSGYRHRAYNASIGGASQSRHIWEEHRMEPATDLVFATGTPEQWAGFAAQLAAVSGFGAGIGTYRTMGFVHVDLRPVATRWSGRGDLL